MRLREINEQESKLNKVKKFARWAIDELGIEQEPNIKYGNDMNHVLDNRTFGSTKPNGDIWVHLGNRNSADIMRTLCHELVHHRQFEIGTAHEQMNEDERQEIEDEANAIAGRMMRVYGKQHGDIYESRSKLRSDEASALDSAYIIPELPNSDFYKQYRFGVALAGAKGRKNREQEPPDLGASSAWGESMIVVGYADGIDEYIDDALQSIGMKPSAKVLTSSKPSEETKSTPKHSPVQGFKGFK